MGMSLADADGLSLYEYEELLWHNNEAYEPDGPSAAAAPPNPERTRRVLDQIRANPLLTH
jgi:hypothetical protein